MTILIKSLVVAFSFAIMCFPTTSLVRSREKLLKMINRHLQFNSNGTVSDATYKVMV